VRPNVELTGARRRAALAVRRKMNSGAAWPGQYAVARPVERSVRARIAHPKNGHGSWSYERPEHGH